MVFLPQSKNQRDIVKSLFEEQILRQGLKILGWREVPVDHTCLGSIAALTEPNIQQIFIGKGEDIAATKFDARLFTARKIAEHKVEKSELSESHYFYVSSLSTNTLIYKGL